MRLCRIVFCIGLICSKSLQLVCVPTKFTFNDMHAIFKIVAFLFLLLKTIEVTRRHLHVLPLILHGLMLFNSFNKVMLFYSLNKVLLLLLSTGL